MVIYKIKRVNDKTTKKKHVILIMIIKENMKQGKFLHILVFFKA